MTATDRKEIEERMHALDDHALLRFVTIEAPQYRHTSQSLVVGLEIAREELRRRRLPVLSTEQYYTQFPKEKKSLSLGKSSRKFAFDMLWVTAVIGGLALPLLVLNLTMEKHLVGSAELERITQWGAMAFWLLIVLPAIHKARTTELSGDRLGKETVIACVAFGLATSLIVLAKLIDLHGNLR